MDYFPVEIYYEIFSYLIPAAITDFNNEFYKELTNINYYGQNLILKFALVNSLKKYILPLAFLSSNALKSLLLYERAAEWKFKCFNNTYSSYKKYALSFDTILFINLKHFENNLQNYYSLFSLDFLRSNIYIKINNSLIFHLWVEREPFYSLNNTYVSVIFSNKIPTFDYYFENRIKKFISYNISYGDNIIKYKEIIKNEPNIKIEHFKLFIKFISNQLKILPGAKYILYEWC